MGQIRNSVRIGCVDRVSFLPVCLCDSLAGESYSCAAMCTSAVLCTCHFQDLAILKARRSEL